MRHPKPRKSFHSIDFCLLRDRKNTQVLPNQPLQVSQKNDRLATVLLILAYKNSLNHFAIPRQFWCKSLSNSRKIPTNSDKQPIAQRRPWLRSPKDLRQSAHSGSSSFSHQHNLQHPQREISNSIWPLSQPRNGLTTNQSIKKAFSPAGYPVAETHRVTARHSSWNRS